MHTQSDKITSQEKCERIHTFELTQKKLNESVEARLSSADVYDQLTGAVRAHKKAWAFFIFNTERRSGEHSKGSCWPIESVRCFTPFNECIRCCWDWLHYILHTLGVGTAQHTRSSIGSSSKQSLYTAAQIHSFVLTMISTSQLTLVLNFEFIKNARKKSCCETSKNEWVQAKINENAYWNLECTSHSCNVPMLVSVFSLLIANSLSSLFLSYKCFDQQNNL